MSCPKILVWTAPMAAAAALINSTRTMAQMSLSILDGFAQTAAARSNRWAIVRSSYCSTATITGEVLICPPLLRWTT